MATITSEWTPARAGEIELRVEHLDDSVEQAVVRAWGCAVVRAPAWPEVGFYERESGRRMDVEDVLAAMLGGPPDRPTIERLHALG